MKELWLPLVCLLLLAACCVMAGYSLAERHGRDAIGEAQRSAAVCTDQLQSKADALDQVRGELAAARDRHAHALATATAALEARGAELDTLKADRDARRAAIGKLTDEDPAVAALAGLPVPHALARQLWPDAAHAGAAAPH